MVGIQGIGGVPEPKPDRPENARDHSAPPVESGSASQDDVLISNQAHAAARLAATINAAQEQPDIRADRVEQAKQAIERGDYKNPDIVAQVAARIDKHL